MVYLYIVMNHNNEAVLLQEIPSSGIWTFVWHYIKNRKFFILSIIFIGISWASVMVLRPWVMKQIIDVGENQHKILIFLCISFVGLSIWNAVVTNFYTYMNSKTYPKIVSKIIIDMYKHLLGHSFSYFKDNLSGSLTNKINTVSSHFEQLIRIPVEKFFTGTIRIILSCILLFMSVNIYFSLTLLIWTIFFIGGTYKIAKGSKEFSTKFAESRATVTGKITDSIANVANIKIFSRNNAEMEHLEKEVIEHASLAERLEKYILKINIFQGLSVIVLISIMLFLLVYFNKKNIVSAGDFVLVIVLTTSLVDAIYMLGRQIVEFSRYVGLCDQALSFIREPYGIADVEGAQDIKITRGKVLLSDVSFSYDKKNTILNNINLRISAGEKIGIVGHSGGGKTTLIKILLRLYDLDKGIIKIDNQDISKVTRFSLRESISMIPQEPAFFHRSIADNILVAKSQASREEVIAAAKKAYCHDFIMDLENGYDSIVGERGVKLSGGQRQRLAVARVILKDAPILILDEATSSLDSVTENSIQQAIRVAMKDKTTIVIAHRLSTLKEMDRIIVIENGEILEVGTPDKLLKSNSYFSKIWKLQVDGFINI